MGDAAELKKPHDLYVAFAFAVADVLFELDGEHRITFAVGAAMSLLGRPARKLVGQPFIDQFEAAAQPELRRALAAMAGGGRVRGVVLAAHHDGGQSVSVDLSGYRNPQNPAQLVVVLAHSRMRPRTEHRVAQSGLLDAEGFRAVADELLRNAPTDEPYRLTLLELPEVERIRAEQGSPAAEAFVAALGSRLKALSAGGDAAGQLGDDRYGIIHDVHLDAGSIERAVKEVAAEIAPTTTITPKTATLVLDVADVPVDDIPSVLAYALNSFSKSDEAGGGLAAFAAGLQPRLSATVREMKTVRETIADGKFEILYQPIVDLWTKVVHHYECLIRFTGNGDKSPYDTVVFAEDTGLAGELDLAVTNRVLDALAAVPFRHPALRFAVNLSGRSLSDPKVTGVLRPLLAEAATTLKGRLLFELTESAEIHDFPSVNAVLQEIRGHGFEVCLDDFGAGAAAFHYLRALKVDHVKIDGCYIRDCLENPQSAAFIRAIVGLCTELGIHTIAEFVETAEIANFLKLLKVRYAQGYLYGKPMRPAKGRPGDNMTPWLTPLTEWKNGLLYAK